MAENKCLAEVIYPYNWSEKTLLPPCRAISSIKAYLEVQDT